MDVEVPIPLTRVGATRTDGDENHRQCIVGDVAQPGERLLCKQEVGSSILPISTSVSEEILRWSLVGRAGMNYNFFS